jgi:hypothetical protein
VGHIGLARAVNAGGTSRECGGPRSDAACRS